MRDCILFYDGVRLDFRRCLGSGLVPRRAQIPGQRMDVVPRRGLAKETTRNRLPVFPWGVRTRS